MDLFILMIRVALWMATSGGETPTTESLEECARGQIVPC